MTTTLADLAAALLGTQSVPEIKPVRFVAGRAMSGKLHADPELAAARRERMKKLNADPEFE